MFEEEIRIISKIQFSALFQVFNDLMVIWIWNGMKNIRCLNNNIVYPDNYTKYKKIMKKLMKKLMKNFKLMKRDNTKDELLTKIEIRN